MAAKIDKIKLAEMANGALQELFENDLGKVINNINDPNTSAKKARKISFELKFVPLDEKRELVNVSIKHNNQNNISSCGGHNYKYDYFIKGRCSGSCGVRQSTAGSNEFQ